MKFLQNAALLTLCYTIVACTQNTNSMQPDNYSSESAEIPSGMEEVDPQQFYQYSLPEDFKSISQVFYEGGESNAVILFAKVGYPEVKLLGLHLANGVEHVNLVERKDRLNDKIFAAACNEVGMIKLRLESQGQQSEGDDLIITCRGIGAEPAHSYVQREEIISTAKYSFVSADGDDLGDIVINDTLRVIILKTNVSSRSCTGRIIEHPVRNSENAFLVRGNDLTNGQCEVVIPFELLDQIETKQVVINLQSKNGETWYGKAWFERQ